MTGPPGRGTNGGGAGGNAGASPPSWIVVAGLLAYGAVVIAVMVVRNHRAFTHWADEWKAAIEYRRDVLRAEWLVSEGITEGIPNGG